MLSDHSSGDKITLKILVLTVLSFCMLLLRYDSNFNNNVQNVCFAQKPSLGNSHTKPEISSAQSLLIYEDWINFMTAKPSFNHATFFLRFNQSKSRQVSSVKLDTLGVTFLANSRTFHFKLTLTGNYDIDLEKAKKAFTSSMCSMTS